jgi:hypothetical protein
MDVSYFGPAQRSWDRARRVLFAPFRAETWLLFGFAAFLSEWFTGGGFGGGTGGGGRPHVGGRANLDDLRPAIEKLRDFFQDPFWMGLILWLIAGLVAVAILFQWIASRGKFVFLDAAVRERATIRDSWSRLGHLGDSLFLCRLVMGLVALALILGVGFVTVGGGLRELLLGREDPFAVLAPMLGGLVLLGGIGLIVAFVFMLLDSFVVPIMYRHHIGAGAAWGRFLSLFGAHLISFIAYAVMLLVFNLAKAALVMAFGLFTCCIGFMLLIIPYVGQVVLLPIHLFFRGLGPDFLAQFGPEFDVYATLPAAPVATAPPLAPGPTA